MQAAIHPELAQRVLCYQDPRGDFHDHFIQHDFEQSGHLSDALLEELRLARYHELLIRARYFRQQPVEVISQLVKHFVEAIDLPGDFIIRNGEVDHHIFFMRSGQAAVYVTEEPPVWESEPVRYFCGGDSFGEVSVLASTPRTAWIMARTYCILTKVHSSSLMHVLHSHPGSFLLLVKNLLEYQDDLKVDWKLPWTDLKVKLKKIYPSSQEAFNQFSMGTSLITHASFESAMECLGLEAGLEMQIRWAELDLDCNGDVSYDEFSTLTVQPGNFHRELLRRRLAKGDAMGEVSAMVERKIAEGHASLEPWVQNDRDFSTKNGAASLQGGTRIRSRIRSREPRRRPAAVEVAEAVVPKMEAV
eukprot:g16588.t1